MARTILYALWLSAGLALVSFSSLWWAANKSQRIFMVVLFGGLILRLLIVGAAVFWVWKFTQLDRKTFTVMLLSSYFIFQIIETTILQRLLKRMKLARRV
ncbi:MAG: hypothetical protein ACREOO_08565 [bacterium]